MDLNTYYKEKKNEGKDTKGMPETKAKDTGKRGKKRRIIKANEAIQFFVKKNEPRDSDSYKGTVQINGKTVALRTILMVALFWIGLIAGRYIDINIYVFGIVVSLLLLVVGLIKVDSG